MKKTLLRKYARLIAVRGANVQKGQVVFLNANVENADFAVMVADECYKAGAKRVDMKWYYLPMTSLSLRKESTKVLSEVLKWEEEKLKLMVEELPCRIFLIGDDPDGLNKVNPAKMQKVNIARTKITKPYRDAIDNKHQWTIAGVPTADWAKKVFPGERKSVAIEKLWKAILDSVRVSEDGDPVEAWNEHNRTFKEKSDFLNKCKFDYIEYKSSNGTDFKVGLIPQGRWHGGADTTLSGVSYNPNLPSEEIFTSPMRGKAEGKVVSTKPLSYEGQIIDKFWIEFHEGKAVKWGAEKGEELLGEMLNTDEGSKYIGELALVPCKSPINESGILYYETLYDENASCHIAVGEGFADCIDDFENIGLEGCRKLGINESLIHVDFMVGSEDMCITGYKDGKATPIFVNGNWA